MSCIARHDNYPRYMDVVMASANAPAIGPPVEIDKGQHVDGGARAQIFARGFVRREIVASGILGPAAYFLVNGKIEGGIDELEEGWEDKAFPIIRTASRGLEILEHEALTLVLHYFQKYLAAFDRQIYVSRTPADVPLEYKKRDFPREKMAALFREGCGWGWNMHPWPQWTRLDLPGPRDPFPSTGWQDPPPECVAVVKRPEKLCAPDEP